MVQGYAGDVDPGEAWRILADEPKAVLVDVRTDAEWSYVGVPDLGVIGKEPVLVSWQVFPAMEVNPGFAADVTAKGVTPDQTVLLLCRSGVRSQAAAEALTTAGFVRCLNIAGGFEGVRDTDLHRGHVNGWKKQGLPWVQG